MTFAKTKLAKSKGPNKKYKGKKQTKIEFPSDLVSLG